MSLPIWVKVGTHALGAFWLKSKRAYPKAGDIIEIKPRTDSGAKWQKVIVTSHIYERQDHIKADRY